MMFDQKRKQNKTKQSRFFKGKNQYNIFSTEFLQNVVSSEVHLRTKFCSAWMGDP